MLTLALQNNDGQLDILWMLLSCNSHPSWVLAVPAGANKSLSLISGRPLPFYLRKTVLPCWVDPHRPRDSYFLLPNSVGSTKAAWGLHPSWKQQQQQQHAFGRAAEGVSEGTRLCPRCGFLQKLLAMGVAGCSGRLLKLVEQMQGWKAANANRG